MRHYKKHRKNPRRRKSSGAGDVLRVVLVAAGVGGIVYIVYQIVSNSPVASGGGIAPSTGNAWDYLYNAATGKPTASQITPASANVYSGPNAPAGNADMQAFLNGGHNINDVVPGTGQTVSDLIGIGYSWNDINQMFASVPSLFGMSAADAAAGKASSWTDFFSKIWGFLNPPNQFVTVNPDGGLQGIRKALVSPWN